MGLLLRELKVYLEKEPLEVHMTHFILDKIGSENFNKKIIFRNIIYFISITFLIYFFFIIFELINNPWALFELNKAQILQFDSRILNEATPRSTGAAKGILIFTFLIFFDQFLNNNKIIKNIIIFLLGFIIFSLFSMLCVGSSLIYFCEGVLSFGSW